MSIGDTLCKIRYFGLVESARKAYEKFYLNRIRFGEKEKCCIPVFPSKQVNSVREDGTPLTGGMICYLVHCFYPDSRGGTERFVLNCARQQMAAGNKAIVVTLGIHAKREYPFSCGRILFRTYLYDGVEVVEFRYRHAPTGLYYKRINGDDADLSMLASLLLKKYSPDIVHCAYPQPFASFLRVCRERKVPYIITLTDFNILCHYATMVDKGGSFCGGCDSGRRCREKCATCLPMTLADRYEQAQKILTGAHALTAPSRFVSDVIRNEFGGAAVTVVPHGIDAAFRPQIPRNSTRRFLYAGTMSDLKGIHLLVEAFAKLQGNYTLDIYGGGNEEYISRLKNAADSRVMFHGPAAAAAMPEIYNRADCIVVPSVWYETYNFVLREALRCGCFAVVSDIGAMPEAVSEGRNGTVFIPGDSASLLAALKRAAGFDWKGYLPSRFPSLGEESRQYGQLYSQCIHRGE